MNKQIRKNIILLKEKSSSVREYESLKKKTDEIHYVPVISYESVNLEELHEHITSRLADVAGVIITSQRAVHSLLELVKRLQNECQSKDDTFCSASGTTNKKSPVVQSLLQKPCFVVGPNTGGLLADGGFLDVRGADDSPLSTNACKVGNAKDLGELIIADKDAQTTRISDKDTQTLRILDTDQGSLSTESYGRKHLLFLTGEIRKDTIPEMLQQHKLRYVEKVIYKTKPASPSDTLRRMNQVIKDTSSTGSEDFYGSKDSTCYNWVVFYSSQGVSSIVQQLLQDPHVKHSSRNASNRKIQNNVANIKVASIGPSTGQYLMDQGIVPDVIASRPTAAKLFEEIELHHSKIK